MFDRKAHSTFFYCEPDRTTHKQVAAILHFQLAQRFATVIVFQSYHLWGAADYRTEPRTTQHVISYTPALMVYQAGSSQIFFVSRGIDVIAIGIGYVEAFSG